MTVGLPGTGIGGMFYVLSALLLPFRECYRRLRGRAHVPARVVSGLALITLGIVASMWLVGWLIGVMLTSSSRIPYLAMFHTTSIAGGNVLHVNIVVLTLATLAAVLLAIEILGWWFRPAPAQPGALPLALRRRKASGAGTAVVVIVSALGFTPRVAAQHGTTVAYHLARADSARLAGNSRVAAHEYAIVLAVDSNNAAAIYHLAVLERTDPPRALALFERYVTLAPSDPWGYMAVGDALARLGRFDAALEAYGAALTRAPLERDAVIGRARVLAKAGRTDQARAAYRDWLNGHPRDAEGWAELAHQEMRAGRTRDAAHSLAQAQALAPDPALARRLALARADAAPGITPLTSGSYDSDGNSTFRYGGVLDFGVHGATRVGVSGWRENAQDDGTRVGLGQLALQLSSQPAAPVRIEATAGGTRVEPIGAQLASVTPTGDLRVRWRAPASGPTADLRLQRTVLDATPELLTNRVVRTEAGGQVEFPLAARVKLRGIGRAASLSDATDVNQRFTTAGVLAFMVAPSVELSGEVHTVSYAHATTAGYFAPRLAQTVQAGSYFEIETGRGGLLAGDVGLGVQRVAPQGTPLGPWRRALNLYALFTLPLAPGRDLRLEMDVEDSPIALEVTAPTGEWRYFAGSVSLRCAIP